MNQANTSKANAVKDVKKVTGVQDFINDVHAEQKHKNRLQFDSLIHRGLVKASDASVFHSLGKKLEVKFNYENY